MKLNGKAKEDFGIWHFERDTPIEEYKNFNNLSETCKNALIIEWLDSVMLQINIYAWDLDKYSFSILKDGRYLTNKTNKKSTRQEATEKAIEKAMEIYNETIK